jgi:SAM-dependent methyltransferase
MIVASLKRAFRAVVPAKPSIPVEEECGPMIGTYNESFRDTWIRDALAKIPRGARLLDAGAGEQQYRKYCTHLQYVSQDFAQYDGQGNGAGLQMGYWDSRNVDIVSDISAIPEPDGSFDAVICTEVLEHLPEPVLALREFSRLMRSGGHLILTAPFISLTHFAPYHFATGFNRYFYEHHLPLLGFEIARLDFNGTFIESIAQELRRIGTVAETYCGVSDVTKLNAKIWPLLSELEAIASQDRGSAELLCHGLCVAAVKK